MTSHAQEQVVQSFRADAESLRDLHAIAFSRALEINSTASVEYEVWRKDNFAFQTADIETVLKERNGSETAITAIRANIRANEDLDLQVLLSDGIGISGWGEDRAKFLLLTSDLRTLIRERMSGRKSHFVDRRWVFMPLILWVAVLVVYVAIGNWYTDSKSDRVNAPYRASYKELNDGYSAASKRNLATARELQSGGDMQDEIDFLFDIRVRQLEAEVAYDELNDNAAVYEEPWWYPSGNPLVGLGIPTAITAAIYLVWRVFLRRSPEAVFLFGDQVAIQFKKDALRDKIVWGVWVALGVSLVSGVFLALLSL